MILHKGRIAKITENTVIVSISTNADECKGCVATLMCGKQEKLEIPTEQAERFKIGQPVTVGMQVGVQRRGTLLFFIMPILILVGTLFITLQTGAKEWASAAISLCAAGAWYALLIACRARIRTKAEVVIVD